MARQREDGDSPGRVELASVPGRPRAWTLLVDGTPQSHVDLDDPQYLEFEYMRWLGHLADLTAPPGTPLDVLHLGGGGLTLARYVAATRPGSSQLAVEADPAVADLVRERLPLDQRPRRAGGGRAGRVRVRVADARAVLEDAPAGSADLVIADLFAGARTPAHLTSVEFDAAALRRRSGFHLLLLAMLTAIACADLSMLSKAEVERIWLPFTIWLTAAPALLPVRSHRVWLAINAAGALLVNTVMVTNW